MPQVWIAGSINMDIVVSTPRRPRDGETVLGDRLEFFPGGKGANQAVAVAQAGTPVSLIGAVGEDAFGEQLMRFLRDRRVGVTRIVTVADAPTGTALIVLDAEGQNSIIVVPGANNVWTPERMEVPLTAGDVALAQLEIPIESVERWLSSAKTAGATTVLNAAPAREGADRLLGVVDVLVVNELELSFLLSEEVEPSASVTEVVDAASALRTRADQTVVVTLGHRGAVAVGPQGVLVADGRSVDAVDTTGAGDCFVGTLSAQIVVGLDLGRTLKLANTAASICVQRMGAGTSMPSAAEVAEVLTAHDF